ADPARLDFTDCRLPECSPLGKHLSPEAFVALAEHLDVGRRALFEFCYLTGKREGQMSRTMWAHYNAETAEFTWNATEVKAKRQPCSSTASAGTTLPPPLVAAPAPADRHPDHNALAVLLRFAIDRFVWPNGGGFAQIAYIVHGDVRARCLRLSLAPVERVKKRAAILCHRSQLVLSRRRFLSHASEMECFVDPAAASPAHRVLDATFAAGNLSLRLAPPASPAAALPATLDVLTADDPGCVVRLRSRKVGPWRREVELPVDRVPARLLVKCEAPHLFFDAAGWREIALPDQTGAPGQLPRRAPESQTMRRTGCE